MFEEFIFWVLPYVIVTGWFIGLAWVACMTIVCRHYDDMTDEIIRDLRDCKGRMTDDD